MTRRHLIILLSMTLFTINPSAASPQNDQEDFANWKREFIGRAMDEGIKPHILNSSIRDLNRKDEILKNYKNQPEFEVNFQKYKEWFVNESTIQKGRKMLEKHASLLDDLYLQYGTQPKFIVAIWGIESRFGEQGKKYPVLPSLATLAHGSERKSYFEDELIHLLKIIQDKNLDPDSLKGSWAGAMGQPQFMPSSYRKYAIDYERGGFADIWKDESDVLASIANYLSEHGWNPSESWGRSVVSTSTKTAPDERIIYSENQNAASYLVKENFDVLKRYNPSNHYALTVGLLGDQIGPIPASKFQ